MASSSPAKASASKPVSSRLLNMKFMQRPVVSSSSSPSKSHPSPSTTASSIPQPQSQHQSQPGGISKIAIRAARAEEELKREAAITSSVAGAEERWSFAIPPSQKGVEVRGGGEMVGNVRVVIGGDSRGGSGLNGYSGVDGDSSDEEEDDETANGCSNGTISGMGRRYFGGRVAPVAEEKKSSAAGGGNGDSDDSSDDSSDSDTSASEGEIARRAALKAAEKKRIKERAADKAIRGLTQIGGRAAGGTGGGDFSKMKCYNCDQLGHKSADCPKKRARGNGKKDQRFGGGGRGEPAVKKQRRY